MPRPASTRLPANGLRPLRRATFAGALIAAALLSCLAATGAGAASNAAEFYARSGNGSSLSCAIYDGYAGSTTALCEYVSRHTQTKATLRLRLGPPLPHPLAHLQPLQPRQRRRERPHLRAR